MIRVQIGNSEPRDITDVRSDWINQQINRRRAESPTVCVRVLIDEGLLKINLLTPGCQAGGGRGWLPNDREKRILDLWSKLHLNEASFTGGNVIAFLKQIERLI